MREYTDRGSRVDLCGLEVAVGPVDDDLVGIGEPGRRGKARTGVADGHVVAEEPAHRRNRTGKVDGAEDQHAGAWSERFDQDRHLVLAPFTLCTEVTQPRGPLS